ncbi:MAG: 3-methyl-2-oxobutanoate hydroxymethyltransferase [Xanthomonadaceae bacterium]|nr:3-methyl-2-oxobutanoate hydroxymethyltransferase [Xanthomonadaceae bacterium]
MKSPGVTIRKLHQMKRDRQPIAMLTAYDAGFARLLDRCGIDCILVGDSLGNVIQGRDSTVPVTVAEMAYHVACVRRGTERALLIADLPFLSYSDTGQAIRSAKRLMQAGAEMVKLEGGAAVLEQVAALSRLGVPVCGHLGLTPQSVHHLSGYRVQGRTPDEQQRLIEDAAALERAGASMLVVECIPDALARHLTGASGIPVIGIGAGAGVDGQVLVLYDVLGLYAGHTPRFVRDFLSGSASLDDAIEGYVEAVRRGRFPGSGESFGD